MKKKMMQEDKKQNTFEQEIMSDREKAYRAIGFRHFYQLAGIEGVTFAVRPPRGKRAMWTVATMGLSTQKMRGETQERKTYPEISISLEKDLLEPMRAPDGVLAESDSQHWLFVFLWRAFLIAQQTQEVFSQRVIFPIKIALELKADFSYGFWVAASKFEKRFATKANFPLAMWSLVVLQKEEAHLANVVGLTTLQEYYLPENPWIFTDQRLQKEKSSACVLYQAKQMFRRISTEQRTVCAIHPLGALWDWALRHHGVRLSWKRNHRVWVRAWARGDIAYLAKNSLPLMYQALEPWCASFFKTILTQCERDARTYWEKDWSGLQKAFRPKGMRLAGHWVPLTEELINALDVRMQFRLAKWLGSFSSFSIRHTRPIAWPRVQKGILGWATPETKLPLQRFSLAYRAKPDPLLGDADTGWHFFTGQEAWIRWQKVAHRKRLIVLPMRRVYLVSESISQFQNARIGSWWIRNRRGVWQPLLGAQDYRRLAGLTLRNNRQTQEPHWWRQTRRQEYV